MKNDKSNKKSVNRKKNSGSIGSKTNESSTKLTRDLTKGKRVSNKTLKNQKKGIRSIILVP